MKRYFYTDPLAAAHMAKHFGMKFCDKTGLSVSADPSLWYMADRHYQAGSLFIHPDSLHLLEPKDGDGDDDGYRYYAETQWWLWSGVDHKGNEQVFNKGHKSRTAKRYGMPFFWPESEEA